MNRQLAETVGEWFKKNQRAMPWRENPTAYRVWVSEVMLQQTTVATVHGYFSRFMERYPQLSDLALADEHDVLVLWAGLGYYSRAKNLLKTARILKEEKNFPHNFELLKKLPGIGDYTAGAIASIAFNLPVPLIDTNVDRVLGRFFALKRSEKFFLKNIRAQAEFLVSQASKYGIPPKVWNQALMEIGALLCTTKKTLCSECPLRGSCKAQNLSPLDFPGAKPKPPINIKHESVVILEKDNQVILERIVSGNRRKGLYDLPHQSTGQKIWEFSYRICNDKVYRTVYKKQLAEEWNNNWMLVDIGDIDLYPLISPAKKIINKIYRFTIKNN